MGFGGAAQYVLQGPTEKDKSYVALQGLVVEIKIIDAIKISPLSGLSPTNSTAQPISFQINGFSQKNDKTICWQQYGVGMSPGSNQLTSFAENWPQALNTNSKAPNVFNLGSANSVPLPDDLTIPAGWTIRLAFNQQTDGTITGFNCSVSDSAGAAVGKNLDISLVGQPLAAGGKIGQNDLAKMVAFQVVLVGWANSAYATLTSGSGKIICSSSSQTPLTASTSWPPDADGSNGTGEEANSTYGSLPAEASASLTQTFGVRVGDTPFTYALQMLVVDKGGEIMAGASSDAVHWWHSHLQTAGFVKTGHTTQTTPGLVAVPTPANPSTGNFYMAMLGQSNKNLYWRGSGDGVNWSGGSIGDQESQFAPALMMYYNLKNSGAGPWLGYVANNSSKNLLVCSADFWGDPWSGSALVNQTSKCTPGFTGCIDYFVMVFVANDSSNRLLACRTSGNMVWSGASETGQYSPAAPSISGLGNNLWMAFLCNDPTQEILVCSSADGINWSGATATGHQSRTAPCMTNCGGVLLLAFVGRDDGKVYVCSSPDGAHWSGSASVAGLSSDVAPAIASYSFKLNFALG